MAKRLFSSCLLPVVYNVRALVGLPTAKLSSQSSELQRRLQTANLFRINPVYNLTGRLITRH